MQDNRIDRKYLSVNSLGVYLRNSVKEYREKTDEILYQQTPYTIIASNHDEVIIGFREINNSTVLKQMLEMEEFSFEEECNKVKNLLFNSCSLACYERGITIDNPENAFEVTNFEHAIEVCQQVIDMGYSLPDNWKCMISQLRFYCEILDTMNQITIAYEEQKKIVEDVYIVIENISDGW